MVERLAMDGGRPVRSRPFPAWPVFGEGEQQRLLKVLNSGQWGRLSGDQVAEFEQRFAACHEAAHGVAVVNGTVALRIALLAAGIEAGDEVIVPPYTFLATATAVVEANATPIFADVDLETFNIDPAAVEAAVTDRTRAIIPVHVGGLPADMDAILDIARRHNLTVIEDAAHAHGAAYKGRRVGALGDMGCFSFQSSKNLTAGEGGIVLSNDENLAARCRSIHNCGRVAGGQWYEHHVIAGNYRLGEFAGAVLNAQLDRLDELAETRDANGRYLAEQLADTPGLHTQKRTADCTRHAYHLFFFRVEAETFGAPRNAVVRALVAEGVPASRGYLLPLYRQPVFADRAFGPYTGYASARPNLNYAATSCPNCETICNEQGAWLTQNLLLGTKKDMDDIVRAFKKVHDNAERLTELAEAVKDK